MKALDDLTFRTRGIAEMVISMAISGTIGFVVVSAGQPVLAVVFWRCVFGSATLLLACLALRLFARPAMSWRQFALALLGGAALVLNWLLLFASYRHASISVATIVYNVQPFMLVGLGMALFGERPPFAKLVWLGIAFSGVVLIGQAPSASEPGADYRWGIALALGSAFCYAVAALVAKRLGEMPPVLIAFIQVTAGALALLPFALSWPLPTGSETWSALLTLGIVHTGVVFVLLYGAIQKLPTHLVGALSFTYPLVAVFVDYLAFDRLLQPVQLLGAGAVLVAAAATTRRGSAKIVSPPADRDCRPSRQHL